MTKTAVILTGLVRNPEIAQAHLKDLEAIPAPERPAILFSTWKGELDNYPDFAASLGALGAIIIEQPQPDIILPGHMLHQVAAFEAALCLLDDDCLVFKVRPDIRIESAFEDFLTLSRMGGPPQAAEGSPFAHKIQIVFTPICTPYYNNDIAFTGYAADLRKLTGITFLTGMRMVRMGPEQVLWSAPFLPRNRMLDAYFRVQPGLIFNNREQNAALRDVLCTNPLYQHVLANWVRTCGASFLFGSLPDPDYERQMAAKSTLEDLIWHQNKAGIGDYHPSAECVFFQSSGAFEAILGGELQTSAFGERVLELIRAPQTPSPDQLLDLADELGTAVALKADVHGANHYFRMGNRYSIPTHMKLWKFGHLGSDLTASLEAEINLMRRAIDQLNEELGR